MRKPLKCNHCGKRMSRVDGAGLHCGDDCTKEHYEKLAGAEAELLMQGFVPADAPNIYIKDGVALTLHEVKTHGMDQAIVRHQRVCSLQGVGGTDEGMSAQGAASDAADRDKGQTGGDGAREPLRQAGGQQRGRGRRA